MYTEEFVFVELTWIQIVGIEVDQLIVDEMEMLQAIAQIWVKYFHFYTPPRNIHFIVQFLNTWSLQQHYVDMMKDCNLQSSHILCRNETCIKLGRDSKDWSQLINVKIVEILVCCD